jgi:hypothetical protein
MLYTIIQIIQFSLIMKEETKRIDSVVCSISFILVLSFASISVNAAPFPTDFIWGASTSAYQIEGAWNICGKGESWTDWWNNYYLNLTINETGDIADDFYFRFAEDVTLMKEIGLKNFRMSISWTRVLPNGTINNPNPQGI